MRPDTGQKVAVLAKSRQAFTIGPSEKLRDEDADQARGRAFGVAGTSLRRPHNNPGVI
jgi:hypothetical protein